MIGLQPKSTLKYIIIFLQKKMERDTVANMKRDLEQAMGHITILMEDHLLEHF